MADSVENSAPQIAEPAITPGVGHYVLSIEADGSTGGGTEFYRSGDSFSHDSTMPAGKTMGSGDGSCEKGGTDDQAPAPTPGKRQGSWTGALRPGSLTRSFSVAARKLSGWGNAIWKVEEESSASKPWSVYFSSLPKKLRGGLDTRLPIPGPLELLWSWLGAFLGILAVAALNQWATPEVNIAFTVGSFGASAVLIYAMLESKMAQPRNFIGGQLISAVIGITVRVIIHQPWIASPVAMSLALLAMQLTSTTHPPGGATALIAANFETLPKWHGYSYLITILVGSLTMQVIALIVNNLHPRRRYPTFWY